MLHFVRKLINFLYFIGLRLYENEQSVTKIGLSNTGWEKNLYPAQQCLVYVKNAEPVTESIITAAVL